MIRSFRLQLTVWYLAFFSLLFVLFSLFLYGVLSASFKLRLDQNLAAQATTASVLLADELVEDKGDAALAAADVVSELHGNGIAILEGGRVLATAAPFLQGGFEALANAARSEQNVALPDLGAHGARAAVKRLEKNGRTFTIVAADPLEQLAADLAVVRRVLFLALPLMVGLAGGGGFLLATRSLAPLGWMAEQAQNISGSNLETRLEIGNAAEELRVLAASFNELLSRLDQSFESMRRFVADASHELRTPISVIRGEAEVAISHERSPAEYRESLAIVLDESRRLSLLVDDLLNLARADAGSVNLRVEEFYLNDLLAECCRSVQALAKARNIRLDCSTGEDAPFQGDEVLLRRLLVNLLDNAIRYTPPGGQVTASLEAAGPELRIHVSDTGEGIAPEIVPHLFERFYRADRARTRENGGFGLGLAIVKWIAESHKGAVSVASAAGTGSRFTVTLPRHVP